MGYGVILLEILCPSLQNKQSLCFYLPVRYKIKSEDYCSLESLQDEGQDDGMVTTVHMLSSTKTTIVL